MKTLVFISLFLALANAQFFPGFFPSPYRGNPSSDDEYAASLGGAPVGLYSKRHPGRSGGLGGYGGLGGPYGGGAGGSDVSGASLGGAKVGLYGKESPQQSYPVPVPVVQPLAVPFAPVIKRPVIGIPRPYGRPRY